MCRGGAWCVGVGGAWCVVVGLGVWGWGLVCRGGAWCVGVGLGV